MLYAHGRMLVEMHGLRLGVLERGRIGRRREIGERACDDNLEVLQLQCAMVAFTWAAILSKAGLSMTARSASTLRSISMFARFSPAMNTL